MRDDKKPGDDEQNTHGDPDGNVEADTASGGPPEPPEEPSAD